MTKTITAICWAIVALALIGLAIWFLTGNIFGIQTDFGIVNYNSFGTGFYGGNHDKVYEYTVSAAGVKSLKIDWISGSITITPYSGSEIQITEYANRELAENEQLVIRESGGTLVVDYCSKTRITSNMSKLLEIKVPSALAEKLVELGVDATSADISLENLMMEKLYLNVISGNINLADIIAASARLDSTSGDFRLTAVNMDSISICTISGTTRAENSTFKKFDGDSTSGDFILEGSVTELEISTISGGAKVTTSVVLEKVKCDTTSGDIALFIPDTDSVSVRFDSLSGSLTGDIPMMLVNIGGYSFDSISGGVTISRNAS